MNEVSLQNLLTIREASRRLNRCPEVVRRYVREGKLPAHKLGMMWYIRPEDAEALAQKLHHQKE
jgi:excisionase family DNA binding protein